MLFQMNSVPGLKVMLAGSTTSLMKELLPQTCYVPKIQIKIAAKVTAVSGCFNECRIYPPLYFFVDKDVLGLARHANLINRWTACHQGKRLKRSR